MPEVDADTLRTRAVKGTFVLALRKFLLRGLSYVGFLVLARLLTPADFGLFAIVTFFITFLGFFSDIGLGAALIQKKEIDQKTLATTFTLQQSLVTLLVLAAWIIAPHVATVYRLAESEIWLIRALSISLFLTSLKTVPMILLERTLKFDRVVIPEVVEVVSYQASVIVFALLGMGVWSFVWAVLLRGVLGVGAMYAVSPWVPRLAWDVQAAKSLIGFGLPYQSNYFIALIKDAVTPVYVGAIAGKDAVGYLNWAFTISKAPIEIISDIFRVTFPAYARIQHDRDLLIRAIETSMKYVNMILFPGIVLVVFLVGPVNQLFFGGKWQPALSAVYIHSVGLFLFGVISTATNALWAIGKVREGMLFMLIATTVNWLVSVPAVHMIGYNGAMVGSSTVLAVSLPLSLVLLSKHVRINWWSQTWPYGLSALGMGIILFVMRPLLNSYMGTAVLVAIAGTVYAVILLCLRRNQLITDLFWVWHHLTKGRKRA